MTVEHERCPRCGWPASTVVKMPEGHTHHAQLRCDGPARHFLRWLKRPEGGEGARPTFRRSDYSGMELPIPARLRGTEKQVAYAQKCRAALFNRARAAGDREAMALINSVADASYFIANRDRRPRDLPEPSPGQLEGGGADGRRPA